MSSLPLLPLLAALAPFTAGSGLPTGLPLPAQDTEAQAPGPLGDWTEDQLWRAFRAAPERKREGLVDYLRLDLGYADNFQRRLMNYVLALPGIERGEYRDAPDPVWYDPETLAPAQPIARRLLDPDAPRTLALREKLHKVRPPRRLRPGWAYDWGLGETVRLADEDDPERHFANALAGFPPELDLAEAIVTSIVDDRSRQAAAAAFDHLYTDRSGNAYPGTTLYQAWDSAISIEMPDVDTLGLALDLEGQLKRRWKAPVPVREHEELYGMLEEHFVDLRRFRGLRSALARAYLIGEPVYAGGYASGNHDGFHGFWESSASDPLMAAGDVPEAAGWEKFLTGLVENLAEDEELLALARARRATLVANENHVRRRLVALMLDMRMIPATPAEFEAQEEAQREAEQRGPVGPPPPR